MDINPTTIILFGITGDLAQKKILPALYDLYVTGRITNTKIVGFSRRSFSDEQIREFVAELFLTTDFDKNFLDMITYVQGEFDHLESYDILAKHLGELDKSFGGCSNKLFYLSVPPTLYEMIARNLASSGLSVPCIVDSSGGTSFSRILIEKPFGKDLKTAQNLDTLLGELFDESQVYRIDHYLAKDSLLHILDYRKQKSVLEKWNKEYISRVEISLFEKTQVGSRGAFYDGVGAFRDVGQNHVLQMLALVAMDLPTGDDVHKTRTDVLQKISLLSGSVVRGQYDGYLSETGVSPNSNTETFFQMTVGLDTERWRGVPFVLSAGKALSHNMTEIKIYFRDNTEKSFVVPSTDSMPAYQKILMDAIAGDQTVFPSTSEILAEWAFVSPIVEEWKDKKPLVYQIGTDPENIKR